MTPLSLNAERKLLLLRNLDTPSHTRYVDYILRDVDFVGTVETLSKNVCDQTSILNNRYQWLESEAED